MIDYLLERLKAFFTSRLLPITIVYIALFSILVQRIFTIQIVDSPNQVETQNVNVKNRDIKSTRANIRDRNGELLAYNELSYSVVIEDNSALKKNEDKNAVIYKLIQLLEKNGDSIDTDFPIKMDKNGEMSYKVSGTSLNRFLNTAYSFIVEKDGSLDEKYLKASAKETFDFLRYGTSTYHMFQVSEDYSLEDAYKIVAIRYAIFSNYPKYNQIVVATQISDESVAAIKENASDLIGVDIKQDSYRKYKYSEYFSHIIGYTGKISSEELKEMEEKGYTSSDYIGKSGIEQVYETQLAGEKGKEVVSVNAANKVVEVLETKDPKPGNDVYLTIDAKLQEAAYHILENKLAGILLQKIQNTSSYGTKGTKPSGIVIPIYEVYFQLINNNVIDINSFEEQDATSLEQSVYQMYQTAFEQAMREVKQALKPDYNKTDNAGSEELQEYLKYIYSFLSSGDINPQKRVMLTNSINTADATYKKFMDKENQKVGLSEFLQYAIANNWINLSALEIGEDYYSTDEIYQKLVDYICDHISNDDGFSKLIYKNLIFNYKLKGREICLLLFDQGVLEYNGDDIEKLKAGTVGAYEFIRSKIKKLEITPAQLALEPCSGSITVTDPNTGEILAMVTYPSYDNNKMANQVDPVYYSKLAKDLSKPFLNRATQVRTAPGSTFKMVSSFAGLNEGVISTTEKIQDKTQFTKVEKTNGPKCWTSHSHGKINVSEALRDSCNYFFYEVGFRLGGGNNSSFNTNLAFHTLNKYASKFGLDRKTGIEIGEYDPLLTNIDGIRSAIGQGSFDMTPIVLARYASALANGGDIYNLTLLNKIVDQDDKVVKKQEPKLDSKAEGLSETSWNAVRQGMYKVVTEHSGVKESFSDVKEQVAGKTGTAQESKFSPDHALFVSYAPFENPKYTVTTVIPNGYTSANAAETTSEVYKYLFKQITLDDILSEGANLKNNSTVSGD